MADAAGAGAVFGLDSGLGSGFLAAAAGGLGFAFSAGFFAGSFCAAGGVIGLLAGIGALAIPGVGPFIAAGPIMAALSGAAVGAATGGVVGGLIGLGIPEIEAKRYDEKLKKGNYLVAVHTDESEDVDRAKHIFKTAGAEDISTVSEASAPKA